MLAVGSSGRFSRRSHRTTSLFSVVYSRRMVLFRKDLLTPVRTMASFVASDQLGELLAPILEDPRRDGQERERAEGDDRQRPPVWPAVLIEHALVRVDDH